jgi:hypothetical protein
VAAGVRLWTRLRREQLDRRLAAGTSPTATPPLRLRAEELTSMPTRLSMADAAEAIRDADADAPRGELDALATRLRAPTPIAPAGAARAHLLLQGHPAPEDGRPELWERVWDITNALDDHAG